jgi:hypothetical protein
MSNIKFITAGQAQGTYQYKNVRRKVLPRGQHIITGTFKCQAERSASPSEVDCYTGRATQSSSQKTCVPHRESKRGFLSQQHQPWVWWLGTNHPHTWNNNTDSETKERHHLQQNSQKINPSYYVQWMMSYKNWQLLSKVNKSCGDRNKQLSYWNINTLVCLTSRLKLKYGYIITISSTVKKPLEVRPPSIYAISVS